MATKYERPALRFEHPIGFTKIDLKKELPDFPKDALEMPSDSIYKRHSYWGWTATRDEGENEFYLTAYTKAYSEIFVIVLDDDLYDCVIVTHSVIDYIMCRLALAPLGTANMALGLRQIRDQGERNFRHAHSHDPGFPCRECETPSEGAERVRAAKKRRQET